MKRTILFTSGSSLLGSSLVRTLSEKEVRLVVLYHKAFPAGHQKQSIIYRKADIVDRKVLKQIFSTYKPDIVIHLAALSDVDFCETHKDAALLVNVDGTKTICEVSRGKDLQIIYASSSFVFGSGTAPFREDDIPIPRNVYASTKLKGEEIIKNSGIPYTIIRFSTLFGWEPEGARKNIFTTSLQQILKKKKIFLEHDRFFNPISADIASCAIERLLSLKHYPTILHVGGKDRVTRYSFVKSMMRILNLRDTHVLVPVPGSYFGVRAERPRDSTLSTVLMTKILAMNPPDLTQSLEAYVSQRGKHRHKHL